MSNDWRAAQVKEMKTALSAHPFIQFVYTDAKGKSSRQIMDFERMAAGNADILVTSPRDIRAMTPVISQAYEQGKPVILLTRKTLNEQFTAFIGPDDREIAIDAAHYIAKLLYGKGNLIMLQGIPTASTAIQRKESFLSTLKNYPEIKVVASPIANYRRNDAIKAMDKIISSGIQFDAIYAHSDSMASGARMAMKMAGIEPNSKIIVGIDYIPESKQAIINGEQAVSYTYPTAGKEGAETILNLINGTSFEKYQKVPYIRVTHENVHQIDTIFD